MRDRLRVALLIPSLDYGGAERHVVNLVRALAGSGVEPTIIVLNRDAANPLAGPAVAAGASVVQPPYARNDPRVLGWLVSRLRSGEIDVAHSFLWRADVTLALAARLAGFRRAIASERGDRLMPIYVSRRWWWRRLLDRWLTFPTARRIVTNSLAGAEAVARSGGDREKTVVIRNWVDLQAIDAARGIPAPIRVQEGWQNALILGFVGRLSPQKGADAFPRIAAAVVDRAGDRPIRFLMVGDGPQRSQIEAEVARAGLGAKFLLTGAVDAPFPFLHAIDVAVVCSPSESSPNAVLELMACGKPVVAWNAAGLAEILDDGSTGRLVEQGSIGAMADACLGLLADASGRLRMGEAARRVIETRYQPAANARQFADLYGEIAGAAA